MRTCEMAKLVNQRGRNGDGPTIQFSFRCFTHVRILS